MRSTAATRLRPMLGESMRSIKSRHRGRQYRRQHRLVAVSADVAAQDRRIVEIRALSGESRDRIDASGVPVTPGYVDVHTHYDGQVTWDDAIEPSATNSVTTLGMGNCGVGFAPICSTDHDKLIDLMEGVEDTAAFNADDPRPSRGVEPRGG